MPVTKSCSKDQYSQVPINEKTEITNTPTRYGYGVRHIQMGIIFICLSTCFVARGHLGVTIVAMTSLQPAGADNITKVLDLNDTKAGYETVVNDTRIGIANLKSNVGTDEEEWTIYRTYNWPKPVQETVLSSFFLGYCLMAFPNAYISQRWGGKLPLQISLLINGLVSLLTPWFTLWGGWKALSACRVVQGLAQAGTFPGIQTLLAKWVPISERATMSGYVYTGATIGNIIGFQFSGVLADSSWGWPSTYWVVGILCIICFAFLTVFGAATPLVHKTISKEEKSYITGLINSGVVQRRKPAPWKAILTSIPVWANFLTHAGSGAAYVFILTQVPSFFHYILGVDVKNSGLLSSLPYMFSFFSSFTVGLLSDYLTNRNILSVKTARRVFNSISQIGVAVPLICASFATSTTVGVICFISVMSCYMAIHSGWMLNHIDMTPNYSGTLMGIGNTLMNLFVMIIPVLVSNIVVDVTNPVQWRIMFCIVAGMTFLTNIVFVVFLSVEVQPWDGGRIDDAEAEDTKSNEKKDPQ